MSSHQTLWAVAPKGPTSNQIIAEALNTAGTYQDEIILNTGERIKGVWMLPSHSFITDFMRAKQEKNWPFDFDIFSKTGSQKWKRTRYLGDLNTRPSPHEVKAARYAQWAKNKHKDSSP